MKTIWQHSFKPSSSDTIMRWNDSSRDVHPPQYSRSTKTTVMSSFHPYFWALMNHYGYFWGWWEEVWTWTRNWDRNKTKVHLQDRSLALGAPWRKQCPSRSNAHGSMALSFPNHICCRPLSQIHKWMAGDSLLCLAINNKVSFPSQSFWFVSFGRLTCYNGINSYLPTLSL